MNILGYTLKFKQVLSFPLVAAQSYRYNLSALTLKGFDWPFIVTRKRAINPLNPTSSLAVLVLECLIPPTRQREHFILLPNVLKNIEYYVGCHDLHAI